MPIVKTQVFRMPFHAVFDAEQSASVLTEELQQWSAAAAPLFESSGLLPLTSADCDHALLGYRLPVRGPCAMRLVFTVVQLSSPRGDSSALAWVLECADEKCADMLGLSLEFNPVYATSDSQAMPLEPARDAVSTQSPAQVLAWALDTLEACGVRHAIARTP